MNRKKVIYVLILVLILFVIAFFLSSYFLKKEIYSIDSRIKNIEKEKKKETSEYYKTISWLRVQGTNIDTPIIGYNDSKLEENDISSYDVDIDKDNYLWNNDSDEKFYNKVNIMGHNILNLSSHPDSGLKYFVRFDDLMSFIYYDFVENNKYIQYTIDGKDYIYKIFAVEMAYQSELGIEYINDYDKKQLKSYINKTLKNSIYDFDVDVNNKDKFISLITCTRFYGDAFKKEFVVHGRLLRDGEKLVNYKVKKNKKYKKIEKILKGDVKDEKV